MHIHHLTVLQIFLTQSWYGRDRKMPTTGHASQCPKSICSSAYFNIIFWYFKRLNIYFLWLHCLLTTNGQLNDTWLPYKTNQLHVQHDFLFSSKRPVLVRALQNNFNYCRKVLSKKDILIIIKTKTCTPKKSA